jgi:hypothetical protein
MSSNNLKFSSGDIKKNEFLPQLQVRGVYQKSNDKSRERKGGERFVQNKIIP